MTRTRLLILCLAALPAPGAARQVDPELATIDSLVATAQLGDARVRLLAWLEANPRGPGSGGPQAHALFLRGRLATDWQTAEDAYLGVVLGYPTSPQAPEALLLLGQGLLAAATTRTPSTDALRAVSYLERLTKDYPGHPLHDEALLWLARARAATTAGAPGAATRLETAPPPAQPQDTPGYVPVAQPDHRFTVQVAALRSRDGAQRLARRLIDAGFEARVRVGAWPTAAQADSFATCSRQPGFNAIVTDDVRREIRSPMAHGLVRQSLAP